MERQAIAVATAVDNCGAGVGRTAVYVDAAEGRGRCNLPAITQRTEYKVAPGCLKAREVARESPVSA